MTLTSTQPASAQPASAQPASAQPASAQPASARSVLQDLLATRTLQKDDEATSLFPNYRLLHRYQDDIADLNARLAALE